LRPALQPGKSLYTTVREFVENSLDAAEDANILPDVGVKMQELPLVLMMLLL